ncbi:hypothetical protein CAPTEDRAFT_202385 [Capitella teleta]|uniref:Uncharacterized protein n=1 Tax=Capitella teleta TaxID=283909 RepID=R7TC37_CAPTE|nr:hypothetical protein CAPTEDRAFT_202385 [Capitella teleta]|eukprot:ELT91269.1 hypothetical protein CAPTEDRAFT_202385 [Capitella teleta]
MPPIRNTSHRLRRLLPKPARPVSAPPPLGRPIPGDLSLYVARLPFSVHPQVPVFAEGPIKAAVTKAMADIVAAVRVATADAAATAVTEAAAAAVVARAAVLAADSTAATARTAAASALAAATNAESAAAAAMDAAYTADAIAAAVGPVPVPANPNPNPGRSSGKITNRMLSWKEIRRCLSGHKTTKRERRVLDDTNVFVWLVEKKDAPMLLNRKLFDDTVWEWAQTIMGVLVTTTTQQLLQSADGDEGAVAAAGEQNMLLLGIISAGINMSPMTARSKKKSQTQRRRARTRYFYQGKQLCVTTFGFLYK